MASVTVGDLLRDVKLAVEEVIPAGYKVRVEAANPPASEISRNVPRAQRSWRTVIVTLTGASVEPVQAKVIREAAKNVLDSTEIPSTFKYVSINIASAPEKDEDDVSQVVDDLNKLITSDNVPTEVSIRVALSTLSRHMDKTGADYIRKVLRSL